MKYRLIGWAKPEQVTKGAQLLRQACQVLDDRGWLQGMLTDSHGKCCASAAVMIAHRGPVVNIGNTWRAFDAPDGIAVDMVYRLTGFHLPAFNDEPGRTVAQVKDLLNEVADRADEEVARWESEQSQTVGESAA